MLIDYEVYADAPNDKKQIVATPKDLDTVTFSSYDAIAQSFQKALISSNKNDEVQNCMKYLQQLKDAKEVNAAVEKMSPRSTLGVANTTSGISSSFSNQIVSRTSSVAGNHPLAKSNANNAYPRCFSRSFLPR